MSNGLDRIVMAKDPKTGGIYWILDGLRRGPFPSYKAATLDFKKAFSFFSKKGN